MKQLDYILVGGACLVAGYAIGSSLTKARLRRDLEAGRVVDMSGMASMLTDQQRQIVNDLFAAGGQVLAERVGGVVNIIGQAADGRMRQLFQVPAPSPTGASNGVVIDGM